MIEKFFHSGYNRGMSDEILPEVRAYMSAIGSKKTAAKSASSRRNAEVAAASRRKDPMSLPCICGGCPENPKTTCPRGRLLRQRARNTKTEATQ